MLLNQGAPPPKNAPRISNQAKNNKNARCPWPCRPARIQTKSALPCYRRSAISRVFAKSAIKQPSRLRRPWQMLPDRRRRGRDRSAPYWARHLRHRLTLASAACQYKPFRLTDETVRLHIGQDISGIASLSPTSPAYAWRFRLTDETVRLYIGQGISGIASLSPTSPAYAWRFRLTHGLADRRAFKQKAPRPVTGGAQFLAFSLSQLIKQPSRLRRPWQMLPDRRRPCPREPCGSSGCWPWKACK